MSTRQKVLRRFKENLRNQSMGFFRLDQLAKLDRLAVNLTQKSADFLEWINSDLVNLTQNFVENCQDLSNSLPIKDLNRIFSTSRFSLLLKRWVVEYMFRLFLIFEDKSHNNFDSVKELELEDNPLNRYTVESYSERFKKIPKIKWVGQFSLLKRIAASLYIVSYIIFTSLKNGIKLSSKKKNFKVLREAIWGLYDVNGFYFHDDFMVDGGKIKKEDLLLFSRGIPQCSWRLKAYFDAKKSPYEHFNIVQLKLNTETLFSRIIPKYIISSSFVLLRHSRSKNFLLALNVYYYFILYAISYEKIFSNYRIISELGHNYFMPSHIAESIVCQNHGVKYYLMHWSDNSANMNKYISSFLSCDKYFLWGKKLFREVEGTAQILLYTGYVFKKFIKEVIKDRGNIRLKLKLPTDKKIVTFFDESFGGACKMTEAHFVTFWKAALSLAEKEKDVVVIVKSKDAEKVNNLSEEMKRKFFEIKGQIEKMVNMQIADTNRWSFIEYIGISDIVVTQGMTSSATIAIICGIEGLYLDQADYKHPFSNNFKNRLVFSEPEEILVMINNILSEKESPLREIPEELIRKYDEYPDDSGIDLFREALIKSTENDFLQRKREKVGIIVQARVDSTRLPGKVMKEILGKPLLAHLIERLKLVTSVEAIVIATTLNKDDDVIFNLAQRLGVKVFRGSETNVLERYYQAAREFGFDVIVRITSDCPVMDPFIVTKVIDFYFAKQPVDYVSNVMERTFPRGLDVEVFSFKSLKQAYQSADREYDKEHVTPFIYQHPEMFRLAAYKDERDYSRYRWTVDTLEDFILIEAIYNRLYIQGKHFFYEDILALFERESDLILINQHVCQKEVENR